MLLVAGAASAASLLSLRCQAAQPTPAGTTTTPSGTAKPSGSGPSPLAVFEGDAALDTAVVTFPNEGATVGAYQAKPKGPGPLPGLLICHENRGLTDHIRDVARRFGKQGYAALALGLLSREGGTCKTTSPAQIPDMWASIPLERHVSDSQAGFRGLQAQPSVDKNRIGMIGYCFGGGVTWRTITRLAELKAAAHYGPAPPLADVPSLRAAVFGVYAAEDPRINLGKDPLEAALKQANKTYQIKVYPGAKHAIFNDTGANYSEEQSSQVWKDTLDWFGRYL